jgi:NAD(P)-dependent dehydrogenase (short-subunit alcohol dehydrogenase family)
MISQNTVFAISGGARGITAHCAIALARQYQCRFILLGRTQLSDNEPEWASGASTQADLQKQYIAAMMQQGTKPHPQDIRRAVKNVLGGREVRETVAAIEQAGGQALYVSADVTDGPQLAQALQTAQAQLGTITALLHGAGVLADKNIEQKTPEDFDWVWRVKVDGLRNLLNAVDTQQLAHLVLFSSAAGFYGNVGQTDYAMANETLNKFAHAFAQQHPHCKVHTINWGPWEGGMVTPALQQFFETMNIQVIPKNEGAGILLHELAQPEPHTQTVVGSPMPALKVTPDATLRTYTLRRTLTVEANPFLQHHVIGGNAVLPMVHALNWMANSCEDLYPGYQFFRCDDFRVLKGIVFDETLAPEYVLQLTEVSKDDTHVTFDAMLSSHTDRQRFHYKSQITLRAERPAPPQMARLNLSGGMGAMAGDTLYKEGTLFHGPYFHGLEQVLHLDAQRITTRCIAQDIPVTVQGQFPGQAFDPYIIDSMLQLAVVWARKIQNGGSLPLACNVGEHYLDIPPNSTYYATLDVVEATPHRLLMNITAHHENGRIYSRVEGGQVTISENLNALFQPFQAQQAIR